MGGKSLIPPPEQVVRDCAKCEELLDVAFHPEFGDIGSRLPTIYSQYHPQAVAQKCGSREAFRV